MFNTDTTQYTVGDDKFIDWNDNNKKTEDDGHC